MPVNIRCNNLQCVIGSCFLFFFSVNAYSQLDARLYVDGELNEEMAFKDSVEVVNYVNNITLKAISNGYYFAGMDSVSSNNDLIEVFLHCGEKTGFIISGSKGKNLSKHCSDRLNYFSNHGYPFASVRINSSQIRNGKLIGELIEEKGPFITNDSSFFYNPIKTNSSFIYNLIDHVPSNPFSEKSYSRIAEKIERTSFLSFKRPLDISFQKEKAKLYLDIVENESNTFQGVLGLQQQGERASIIGSINLGIQNLFKSGKELYLNWERFAENSQELSLSYKHPFLLDSKLTPSFKFELLRQDSTFLTQFSELGVSTYLSSKVEIFFGYNRQKGTLLTTDEQLAFQSGLADFHSDLYQLMIGQDDFQKSTQLVSYYAWMLKTGAGEKQINKNLSLPDSFYDTLSLRTNIFRFDLKLAGQLRMLKKQSVHQYIGVGIIENRELLNNERHRLGGSSTLRGFNEKVFFADRYFLGRTEFRSFFEKESYLYLSFDQLLYRNDNFSDSPFGAGLGFSLSTSSGQFSFALAIGASKDQSLDFSNMKAHFGYITVF